MLSRLGPLAGTRVLPSPYQARDRWGRVHIRRPPRSRHLGRLMPPLWPVSCSLFVPYTVAKLPGRRGDGHTGTGGIGEQSLSLGHLKTKSEKSRKQKGAWALTGLGHGLINWCCEWRCPLYSRKETMVALQSFGLKKRTSEVRFAPESGHSEGGRGMSVNDPKRTSTIFQTVSGLR